MCCYCTRHPSRVSTRTSGLRAVQCVPKHWLKGGYEVRGLTGGRFYYTPSLSQELFLSHLAQVLAVLSVRGQYVDIVSDLKQTFERVFQRLSFNIGVDGGKGAVGCGS